MIDPLTIFVWAVVIGAGIFFASSNVWFLWKAIKNKRYPLAIYLFLLGTIATGHFVYILNNGPSPYPYPIYAVGLLLGGMLSNEI